MPDAPDTMKKHRSLVLLLLILLILMIGIGFVFFHNEVLQFLSRLENRKAYPAILIFSFLVLPVVFFPVTALMVLIGIHFGALYGILIVFALMPAHLVFSFFAVRSVFGSRLRRLAEKRNWNIPDIPEDRSVLYGFLFMALPGLPYAVKNYLLPLSGISFRAYFLTGWLIQGGMGIPFVVLGDAASEWSIHLFLMFLLLFVLVYIITKFIRKRYERMVGPDSGRGPALSFPSGGKK